MKLHALSHAIASREQLAALRARPELRKATEQMLFAFAAAGAALASVPTPRERLGLVAGSGQGELETTKEFFKALARENLARPFLFQNSLHHSTTGLLSQALKLTGPAATVSDGFFTAEAALHAAADFLAAGLCDACLVVCADTLVPELDPGLSPRYPEGFARGEGAAAMVVAKDPAPGSFAFSLPTVRTQADRRFPQLPGYYDSDALARLIEGRAERTLTLAKPDGTASLWRLGGEA